MLSDFGIATALGKSDPQTALVPIVAVALALVMLPATAVVAGLTAAVVERDRVSGPDGSG